MVDATAAPSVARQRLPVLDGVRGLGALVVVFAHIVTLFRPAMYSGLASERLSRFDIPLARSPLVMFWSGGLAVSVFFIHSGLVLSRPFLVTKDRQTLWEMALRRLPRLAIPVAAAVLLTAPVLMFGLVYNVAVSAQTHAGAWMGGVYTTRPPLGVVAQSAVLGTLDPVAERILPPLWTMRVEVLGSFTAFGIVALSAGHRHQRAFVVAAIVWATFYSPVPYLGTLLIGVYFASGEVGHLTGAPQPPAKVRWSRVALLLVTLTYFVTATSQSPWHQPTLRALDALGIGSFEFCLAAAAVSVVLLLREARWLQRVFAHSAFQWLGKVSFPVYLLHTPILCSLGAWLYLEVSPRDGYWPAVFVASTATLVLSYSLGTLFQRWVDGPAQRFAHRLSTRSRPAPAQSPAVSIDPHDQ